MVGLRALAFLGVSILSLVSAYPTTISDIESNHTHDADRYIVTLRTGLEYSAVEQHMRQAASLHARSHSPMVEMGRRWSIGAWNAYSCTMDTETLAEISTDDAVELVEPDSPISIMKHVTQVNAPWNLGAISHRMSNHIDYVYDSRGGEGTYAYILDTGILATHDEFEGRAQLGYNALDTPFVDDVGHGTHVAGTIAGKTYGVAKKAKIISIKILGRRVSYTSDFLEGYTWAVSNITLNEREEKSVISISAGGAARESINMAIDEAYKNGILTVVSAGNSNADAKNFSPASAQNAITVGSVGPNYARSTFSNFGELVDIFAPGEYVQSAFIHNDHDTKMAAGTSMATPHISGLILYLKSILPYRMKTPVDSVKELQQLATDGIILNVKGSKNLFGFNGNGVVIPTHSPQDLCDEDS
ncbi:hypothetical protein M426DRAFT_69465 [Hypoxylon sp. CI-4A]|nr:hypothetical protein M426DRAFT_69465 [Hypoxylon sp. CI-4A]